PPPPAESARHSARAFRQRATARSLAEASAEVVVRVGAEWKREGRAEYSQATALRTTAMGMTLFPEDGVAVFRVWAPGIQKVEVERDVETARMTQMAAEGEGIWAGQVTGVQVGDRYRYSLTATSSDHPLRRADPYGRDVDGHGRYTVICEPPLPSLPPSLGGWHDLVIYQIHPRTLGMENAYN